MKRVGILAVAGLLLLASTYGVLAQTTNPNAVLAKVNSEDIFQREIDFTMNYFVIPQYQGQNPGQIMPADQKIQIEQSLINQLITEKLILQQGKAANITLDVNVLNQQFEAVRAQQPNIPPEELKEFLHQKLLVQTVIQNLVSSRVIVTDDELKQVYEERKDQLDEPEQVRTRHILISVESDAAQTEKDAARQKIEDILAQAKGGADFAELARQYSQCPTNQKGGDLGFFPRGVMVQPFEDVAFSLEAGMVSDIVETPFGYHLIKVDERKSERTVTFDEAKERLRQELMGQRVNTEVQKWISDLRTNATIEFGQPQ